MVLNALWITAVGMGGVFAFLVLLICGMNVLRWVVEKTTRANNDKIAVAIAMARTQGE